MDQRLDLSSSTSCAPANAASPAGPLFGLPLLAGAAVWGGAPEGSGSGASVAAAPPALAAVPPRLVLADGGALGGVSTTAGSAWSLGPAALALQGEAAPTGAPVTAPAAAAYRMLQLAPATDLLFSHGGTPAPAGLPQGAPLGSSGPTQPSRLAAASSASAVALHPQPVSAPVLPLGGAWGGLAPAAPALDPVTLSLLQQQLLANTIRDSAPAAGLAAAQAAQQATAGAATGLLPLQQVSAAALAMVQGGSPPAAHPSLLAQPPPTAMAGAAAVSAAAAAQTQQQHQQYVQLPLVLVPIGATASRAVAGIAPTEDARNPPPPAVLLPLAAGPSNGTSCGDGGSDSDSEPGSPGSPGRVKKTRRGCRGGRRRRWGLEHKAVHPAQATATAKGAADDAAAARLQLMHAAALQAQQRAQARTCAAVALACGLAGLASF